MDTALGWIGDFIRYLAQLFPRLQLVRVTERAIKFVRAEAYEVGPGLHIWWPITTEMDVYPVKRRVMSLEQQVIETKDGKTVVVDGVIVFSITDLYTFAVENVDAVDNVSELAEFGLRKAILSTELGEVNEGRAGFDNRLTTQANKALSCFGVDVEMMRLQSCAQGQVLIHTGPSYLSQASEVSDDE